MRTLTPWFTDIAFMVRITCSLLFAANLLLATAHAEEITMKDWKKPAEQTLKQQLTPLQYKVTQNNGTEPAFRNTYWDNKQAGLYVDVVSGEPLFSSRDKFNSGTGWPSFTQPLKPALVVTHTDRSWFIERTEVRSNVANSHLGHVFKDGPAPTGLRYCVNSAALRFIPKEKMKEAGYNAWLAAVSPPAHGSTKP